MNNPYAHFALLLRRLALALLLFSVCRLLFLIFHFQVFRGTGTLHLAGAFVAGLRFDVSAIMYVFGPFILMHALPVNARNNAWWQRSAKWLFMTGMFVCLLLNLVDTGYFTFSGRRSGVELIRMQSPANVSPWVYLLDYWYLLLILVVLMLAAWKLYPSFKKGYVYHGVKAAAGQAGLFLLTVLLSFAAARGSFGLKPLNTLDAARLTSAELMPLTLNTPFQFLLTIEQTGLEYRHYMSDEEATSLFNPVKTVPGSTQRKGRNVVLIIVESLGREYIGYYNKGEGYTPFLDSLMRHSTVFGNAYANGKRSIEGIPAILASMPGWMPGDYLSSVYKSNRLRSTAFYLKQQGYDASFYHGGKNGTMGFDQFIAGTDGGDYYGLNEYPDKRDFDGNWGIYDEPYLRYVANELDGRRSPFYAVVFTLSSHHPYKLPAGLEHRFKKGPLPIHAAIGYTDYALQRFFAVARSKAWYNNTIFVVTADHSSENLRAEYMNSAGKYAIPLFIFDPQDTAGKDVSRTVSQLNIMDEVLNRTLPQGSRYFSLASSIAVQYEGGMYQAVEYPYMIRFDGERTVGLYDLRTDSLLNTNLLNEPSLQGKRDSLTQLLQAQIQEYNRRLIENRAY